MRGGRQGGQRWLAQDQLAGFSVSPRTFIHDAAPARRQFPCGAQSPTPVGAPATRASCQCSVPAEVQGYDQPGISRTPVASRAAAMKLAPHRPVKSWQMPQRRREASTGSVSAARQHGQVNDAPGSRSPPFGGSPRNSGNWSMARRHRCPLDKPCMPFHRLWFSLAGPGPDWPCRSSLSGQPGGTDQNPAPDRAGDCTRNTCASFMRKHRSADGSLKPRDVQRPVLPPRAQN